MSKGFSGVPGNMQALMKQAQKMQKDLQEAAERAQQVAGEGSSGGGMVVCYATGREESPIDRVKLDAQVINPNDKEMLEDLIVAAVNAALNQVAAERKKEMSKVTGGMNIPGIF